MAELIKYTPSYDYSSIGGFGSEAAQSVNGEMINKIRAGEESSIIEPIIDDINNLTLEGEKIDELKTKIADFQNVVDFFNLGNDENVFNQYYFDTSGTAAVYDATDMNTLEEGTTSVNITQLAQRDVYQSAIINDPSTDKPTGTLKIEIDGKTLFGDDLDGNGVLESAIDISTYTYEELAVEISRKEGLSASIEQVGDSNYRLIVKSTETGDSNALTISGTHDLGFINNIDTKFTSDSTVTAYNAGPGGGIVNGSIDINGITFDNSGTNTYASINDLVNDINSNDNLSASIVGDYIEITDSDGNEVTITNNTLNDGAGTNLIFSSSEQRNINHTQQAQNLNATIDGVAYDTSSNSITTQGSLKITAVETGTSTVNVSNDTSAVLIAAETMATQYNELVNFINDELYATDSVIEDKDALKTILNDVKGMILSNYGADPIEWINTDIDGNPEPPEYSNVANNDKNIFVFGFELDKSGNLTVDSDIFNDILNGNNDDYDFDDLKNVFTGAYENKGLGVQLNEYLDNLDGFNGLISTYESDMIIRKEDLEEEKEDELEKLDAKYGIMAEQFAQYSALIAQIESNFTGLKMMIEQSTASN